MNHESLAHLAELNFHCRRGMQETELILSAFLNKHYAALPLHLKKQFSLLLAEEDPTLWDWLVLKHPPADSFKDIVTHIIASCAPT